jgi:hypothetical protein
MTNFTPEDLLEYFYQETPPKKTAAVQAALDTEWPLQQKYNVITQAAEKLDKSILSPRKQSVKAIMDHAAKHEASADVGL